MEAQPSMESQQTLILRGVNLSTLDRITIPLVTGGKHLIAPSTILVHSSGNQIYSKKENRSIDIKATFNKQYQIRNKNKIYV